MKQFLLLLGTLLVTQLGVAQQTTWSINITPTISYRLSALSDADASVRNGERPVHSFDFGVQLRTRLGGRFTLGAGLMYAQRGFANQHVAVPYQRPLLSRGYQIEFIQDYVDIPIFVTFNLAQNEQFVWYVLGGVNNGLLLRERNKVSVRTHEQNIREAPDEIQALLEQPYLGASRQHSLGILGGFGVRARVDDKTFIGLETLSKVMLTPLDDYASGTQRYGYTLGLNFRFVRTLHE